MSDKIEPHFSVDELPRISQKLKLLCRQCGKRARYDVGIIFWQLEGEGESAKSAYTFTKYFRCRACDSPGPWDVTDCMTILALTLRARVDSEFKGLCRGKIVLFDGTFAQTPAMGEQHLLALLQKDPGNAFLCTRLGNLLRGCGKESKSAEWYERALGLDSGDVEARYHLFLFALQARHFRSAAGHAQLLVQYLLEGRKTNKEPLTRGIALWVVDALRDSPARLQEHLLGGSAETSHRKEEIFIRTLLAQKGDPEEIIAAAAERLLQGEVEPPVAQHTAGTVADNQPAAFDLVPSLRKLIQTEGLSEDLAVAFEANGHGNVRVRDRHSVPVYDRNKLAFWPVPSLRELFRGDRQPPPDMCHYPPEYCPYFYFIERQVLTVCAAKGDRTDQELEEIYSAIRRRPDGRSLGELHDVIWQFAALLLGKHVLSGAEFEAIFAQLEHSTRKWALRPVSRNYVSYLRDALTEAA